MKQNQLSTSLSTDIHNRNGLEGSIQEISKECVECNICVKQCAFLKKYGTPKLIADSWQPDNKSAYVMPFECSLCSLCTAVCPVNIDPKRMFLEMRRYTVASGKADLSKQQLLLNFEKRGTSRRFTFYGLSTGCDTVLFPGCALSGSRPKRVMQLFDHLKKLFPNLGIVLDCCTKPSHDLGRTESFHAVFDEMRQYLDSNNIKRILVACPSCYFVFSQYGNGLLTQSVYDILADEEFQSDIKLLSETVTIQDSCVARYEEHMQQSVRKLIENKGVKYQEMKHHGTKTLCCGEGGGAHFVAPELAGNWCKMRKAEVGNKRIITYCAGCAHFLRKVGPTAHLLDLVFDPAPALAGRVRVSRSPFTYLNRLLLKRRFRKKLHYAVSRERDLSS